MKKLLAIGFVAAMIPSLSLAKGGNHPMAGCGLGYVLFGNNDNKPLMQIFAATLTAPRPTRHLECRPGPPVAPKTAR